MDATKHFKMRTVAEQTGFSPAVLRAWERRHGILQPHRGAGGHRLYTEEDVRILGHVRKLLDQGRSIGEISAAGRQALLSEAMETLEASQAQQFPSRAYPEMPSWQPSSDGQLARIRDEIVQRALEMDVDRIEALLDEAFSLVSADRVIHDVVEAGALQIGNLWARGECSVASEHLASSIFVHRVRRLVQAADSRNRAASRIIFSCFPDENHELGLLTLAYYFSKRGQQVLYLGAALPFEDLERACELISPAAIVLSVTRGSVYQTHKPRLIELLKRRAGGTKIFVGGQGAPDHDSELTGAGGRFCPNGKPASQRVDEILGSSS